MRSTKPLVRGERNPTRKAPHQPQGPCFPPVEGGKARVGWRAVDRSEIIRRSEMAFIRPILSASELRSAQKSPL